MVYTVTFNPSLDYIVTVDDLKLGLTNRTTSERLLPGGKGINVSIVLSNLGIENTAIYFSAGFVGQEITRRVKESGINAEEIVLPDGCSRINLKLKSIDGTEINGAGPAITEEAIRDFFDKLDMIQEGDTLVLAGSIPKTLPETIYSDIMERFSGRGIKIVVDATRDLLMNALKYRPFLIKPNNHEIGELFNVKLNTRDEVIPYARKLQEKGAVNVLVSMAGEGAILVDENGNVHKSEAPKGKVVNSVGAGDSMVAGFIYGYLKYQDYDEAFRYGLATGSASAFSEELATNEQVISLYKETWGEKL